MPTLRRDTQYRPSDKPQHPFRGAAEEDCPHIIGIPFASHDDHLDIVLNRLSVDFHTRRPLADDHLGVVFIHPFHTDKFSKPVFRIDEQFFLDLSFRTQMLQNAMLYEILIDDMEYQDFSVGSCSPGFGPLQSKPGAVREIDSHKKNGAFRVRVFLI
jgi:hypothetical protein